MPLFLWALAGAALVWLYYDGAESAVMKATDRRAWIQALYPIAREIERRYGIRPEIALAQWAHETGYGTGTIFKATNNLGSIVATAVNPANAWAEKDPAGNWIAKAGKLIYVSWTTEKRDGVMVKEQRPFRRYELLLDAADDWARLVSKWADAIGAAQLGDAKSYGKAMIRVGYSTWGYSPEQFAATVEQVKGYMV